MMRRWAAVLVSSVLVLGAAGAAPSGAVTGAADRADEVPKARFTDPRGDARGGSERARLLADARAVRYRAPVRPDGQLVAVARMTRVKDVDGGLRQSFRVRLTSLNGRRTWTLTVNHRDQGVRVVATTPSGTREIAPELRDSGPVAGPGGTLSLSVSTEWLPVDRVVVEPALTRAGAARDLTGRSFVFDVAGSDADR